MLRRLTPLLRLVTASMTVCCGKANLCPATVTIKAGAIASVSGSLSLNATPKPGVLAIMIEPPMDSTVCRTMSMPMPRPDTCVTCPAVEKPGAKMKR